MRGDWDPGAYGRFRGLRLRPALDLLSQVPAELPPGDVIDLGCGDGAVAAVLAVRFPARRRVGVDASSAMLEQARRTGAYDGLEQADIALWCPSAPPALIFSNAALHWLPDHDRLFPRLLSMLPAGGVLAIQMPRQHFAPSHVALREVAAALFPDRFDLSDWTPPVEDPAAYFALLEPLAGTEIWETEYFQRLPASSDGHPVRRFTESTAMRPYLDRLDPAETARFIAEYEARVSVNYPLGGDGSVLFPFRRLFVLSTVRDGVR